MQKSNSIMIFAFAASGVVLFIGILISPTSIHYLGLILFLWMILFMVGLLMLSLKFFELMRT